MSDGINSSRTGCICTGTIPAFKISMINNASNPVVGNLKNKETFSRPILIITGANGLIGKALIQRLKSEYKIIGLDLSPNSPPNENPCMVHCDLTEDSSVREAFRFIQQNFGSNIYSVIHLAAYYDFTGKSHHLYKELTIEGTKRLLRNLTQFQVEQLIFSSTLLVMKPSSKDIIDESSPLNLETDWEYPLSKIRVERLLKAFRNNAKLVLFRIAGVYDEFCHSPPLSQQIDRINQASISGFFYPGDPRAGQSFVHLGDLVNAFENALLRKDLLDQVETFLIGEPKKYSYKLLQKKIGLLVHGHEWPSLQIPKPMAKLGAKFENLVKGERKRSLINPKMIDHADDNLKISIDKAKRKLLWRPKHHLVNELPIIIYNMRKNPSLWYRENHLERSEPPSTT